MSYLLFIWRNRQLLIFGFLMAFFASFGQTFYIGIYGAEIRGSFGLSHGEFGGIYSAATLLSGFSLIWLGRQIDRVDLRLFTLVVSIGLAIAVLLMGLAGGAVVLFVALFGLRLTGQGLMTHIAVTSMARYFGAARGRAVSVAMVGVPAGEAVFPLMAVALIGWLGWQRSWWLPGLALVVVLPLLVLRLLRGHGERHRSFMASFDAAGGEEGWTVSRVLRDRRFYAIIGAAIAPSFIITGLFFHHAALAAAKGWSLSWLATAFIAYAVGTIPASLIAGVWVDRWRAARMAQFMLLPLGVALLVVSAWNAPVVAVVYLGLAGLGQGAHIAIMGSLWAELYGVHHLGAIRSLHVAASVLASALSPAALGWLIDQGVTMSAITLGCLLFVLVASGVLGIALRPARRLGAPRRPPVR